MGMTRFFLFGSYDKVAFVWNCTDIGRDGSDDWYALLLLDVVSPASTVFIQKLTDAQRHFFPRDLILFPLENSPRRPVPPGPTDVGQSIQTTILATAWARSIVISSRLECQGLVQVTAAVTG